QPPFSDPLAFHLTWTTYGTWLPGDAPGWFDKHSGVCDSDPIREAAARRRMKEPPLTLSAEQRRIVEETVRDHCRHRGWHLHIVNPRTNHVHAVVTAKETSPRTAREQLKAWCTRRLKQTAGGRLRKNWWTEGGSTRIVDDDEQLEEAITYVRDAQ
ncbi:MAG: transposase, partial [Planctomycetaceae bacterium]